MRRIRHLLTMHFGAGASARLIARELGISPSTVREYLGRAVAAGITWPLDVDATDEILMARLFVNGGVRLGARFHAGPDWAVLARELKRPGVNLMILWEEYRGTHPEGYAYSRFCELFRDFERRLPPTMRQQHVAGHKAFVDYSGKRVPIADPVTGEVRMAEIFVAVLGASSLTYAEATWPQGLPDWVGAHVRMFRYFGAVPRLMVPDNLKSGVNKASFYDPEINRSYAAMAAYYGVGVLPARPRRQRDKAAVEAGVRFAQSYIVGRLRNVTFFSLGECNAAIAIALERMNGREMRRLGISRRQLFETIERHVMQPLPQDDYEYADWHLARVGIDYHVEVQSFFYSVPHALIREQVDTRATARTIEVFHRGKRVAAHVRRYGGPRHGTQPEHMPSAHRRYAEWTPERLQRQARGIGPNTEALIIAVLARRPHPEQGFRTCLGVLRLFRGLDAVWVEAASLRAVEIGALAYASVASILKHRLDRPTSPQATDETPLLHDNIRGSSYYH
ncbi:IS21 family transposase (plasmid) [Lichenicola cladoniae]|uniref:IS21 family transposase n=1 Tax=Lichenicola cladoniae TaxID=1484109 RepID=A0A6M8HXK3_9PROT|nr:IS21 family transposase [Lichenicola cladoniae]NPD69745.1 IS21 family transposase [Acetobacteraceae bacterium]QKE93253.1 IS21 family transposase [Lichenicola cladoniae]